MKIQKNWIRILIIVVILAVVIASAWLSFGKILDLLGYVISLFLPFLLGYAFSLGVNPLANLLQKKLSIPRGFSAILVIILILGVIGGAASWGIYKIIEQTRELYVHFPEIYKSWQNTIKEFLTSWNTLYGALPENIQVLVTEIGETISSKASGFLDNKSQPVVDYASRFAKAIPKAFVAVVVFILASYFMISDSKGVSKAVNYMIPQRLRLRVSDVTEQLKTYLGGYLKAQLMLLCIVFVVMFVEFSILRVNYALLIALGIGVLDALPFFGSGLVLWPWAVISFTTGNIKLGVGLIVVYVSIALVRRFAEPKLLSSKTGTNPVLTLMSMYIAYRLMGIVGLIVGPIVMIFLISLYKARLFDGLINLIKCIFKFIKEQLILLKNFFLKLTGSDWNE